jgi:TolB-like protein/AraC-like DNA-binding protein
MEIQPSMDDQFLSKIYQHIEDNLDNEHFSVEDLAQKAGLSRSMQHRKLIKLTGKSASDLITQKRLLRAKEMLLNNVGTASEIAYKVGFSSPSYFTKVFKNYFHVSPGDVRKGTIPLIPQEIQPVARKKFSRPGLIALIVLLSVAVVGAGIYFIFQKNKPVEKSIAILPFDNLSSDNQNQYFADGIVEDLLNRLSQIEGLKVISRTSSEMFRDKGSKTIPEIAHLLGVSYILEGTVQRQTDKVRINIQLIDARKDNHILSQQYDRNLSDIFRIQSEIAGQIASELSLALTDQQLTSLKQSKTTNLKAYEYCQMGRYLKKRQSKEEFLMSIDYFNKAIQEDSNYASAYVGMADVFQSLTWHKWINQNDKAGRDTAVKLAFKALEKDANLAEAHTVLAAIYQELDCNMEAAAKEYLKALDINPNSAMTYQYYAEMLAETGRLDKARELLNKALILDPFSFSNRITSTTLYRKERNLTKAYDENKFCLALVKDHPWAVEDNFFINLGLNNNTAAFESFKKYGAITGEYRVTEADSAYKASGIEGLLRLKIRTYNWWPGKANCYIMLGENEKAIETLELALNEYRLRPYDFYQVDIRNLQSDPRIKAIKKRLGLQNY